MRTPGLALAAHFDEQLGMRLSDVEVVVHDGDSTDVVSTSMFAPMGRARMDGDHVVIEGRWPFSSGCMHADWFQVGVIVTDGDGRPSSGVPA